MARKQYTDEEIAGFQKKTDDLNDRADAIMDNPSGPEMTAIAAALPQVSARIQGYSPRNQVLLFMQAAEQGFTLTDVATARQWRELGRPVRPDQKWCGLRIAAVKGSDTEHVNDGKGGVAVKERILFRMISVFDISQTASE